MFLLVCEIPQWLLSPLMSVLLSRYHPHRLVPPSDLIVDGTGTGRRTPLSAVIHEELLGGPWLAINVSYD